MSNLSDVIGEANLSNGSSFSFTYNRFCSSNSAIYFNQGYLQVPEGLYFNGEFTFIAWIKFKFVSSNLIILDFSNGVNKNKIKLGVSCTKIMASIGSISKYCKSFLEPGVWNHVAYVSNSTVFWFYLNGLQILKTISMDPYNAPTSFNFFGTNSNKNPSSNAIFSDIKLYSGAMNSDDILNDFIMNSENGKI
jgi:hypothetical protein